MNKVSKTIKYKRAIQSISFVIMGITILDVIFYSTVQISKGLSKTANGGAISLFFAGLGLIFAAIDLIQLCYFSFQETNTVADNTSESDQVGNNTIYRAFASITYRKEAVAKSKLVRSLNVFFLLRFAVSQLIISIFQNNSGTQVAALFIVNLAYAVYFGITIFKVKKSCSSNWDCIQKIIIEGLLIVFHILILVFNSDPKNTKFSSDTTELFQKIIMMLVLIIVLSQTLSFALVVIKKFKNRKSSAIKDDNKLGPVENINNVRTSKFK